MVITPEARAENSLGRIVSTLHKECFVLAMVAVVAAVVAFAILRAGGPMDRTTRGDAPYFNGLATSMAQGKGYVLERGPWPTSPHMVRLPLWPVLLTPGMWLFPNIGEYAVMRYAEIIVHSLGAMLLALLTWRLWSNLLAALVSGVLFAVYPPELGLLLDGYSEPAFILVAMAGLLPLFRSSLRAQIGGALLSGLAVLCRANYMIVPVVAIMAMIVLNRSLRAPWRRIFVLLAVFYIFPSLWIARNYLASGVFPLFNAGEGEVLYGGNNVVVATELAEWGYWVMPNRVPGEVPKHELGKRMSEVEVNSYYHGRAVQYFRANWFGYPRLIVGKLIRGFVPVPWVPRLASYFGFACRGILFAVFLWYAVRRGIANRPFGIYLFSVFLMVLMTTVVYYGCARFTSTLEVFLIPSVGAGLAQYMQGRHRIWSVPQIR